MSTLVVTPRKQARPQPEPKPAETLNGRVYVVFTTLERKYVTEPVSLAVFALAPVPNTTDDQWNTCEVHIPVTDDGLAHLALFINADGKVLCEGIYPQGTRVYKGDTVNFVEHAFRITGLKL